MDHSTVAPEVREYYDRLGETTRLTEGVQGRLEFWRTQDILRRLIGPDPVSVVDVGGATGIHAAWLAADGHRVRLVDPIDSQVQVAAGIDGVDAVVGDARDLPCADGSADVVLLMGPLYHLQTREERLTALREARRVARAEGLVVAATINRFSPWHDLLARRIFDDFDAAAVDAFLAEVATTGRLRPREHGLPVFTTAYLHRPEEITGEFTDAGLPGPEVYSVEGAAWLASGLDADLDDPGRRARILDGLRTFEREPSLLGVSSHLLTAARAA